MPREAIFVLAVLITAAVTGVVTYMVRRRRRALADATNYAALKAEDLHIPASLHPEIDPDLCISCLACVRVCPEGEILGIVGRSVRLIDGSECIGHGLCALECPVGAIKLVFGTSERGLDLPEVNTVFESSRPGVHVIGELGGMGLIKNAMTQGRQVVDYFARRLDRTRGRGVDVVIVGAGPAGLSAAASCTAAGLSHVVLEQDVLGGTVAHYPRQKVVMSEMVRVPGYGKFGAKTMVKEDLVDAFRDLVAKGQVKIKERVRVDGVEGTPGNFVVKTSGGEFEGRRVVLATGRRGTPRRLGVPGEELDKVTYGLIDPDQYQNSKVLVVGGGDSAIEAACTLADESNAEVVISYRREAFGRCRPANKTRIADLIAKKRIVSLMSSEVKKVETDRVVMQVADKTLALKNDFIIASIGGELPLEFLKRTNVKVRRFTGQEAGVGPSARSDQEQGSRLLASSLIAIGALIIAGLIFVGGDYYLLPRAARLHHPYHDALKPSGVWGHGVGIVATAFMMLNFFYPARKRLRFLRWAGRLRNWLTFHTFVGFMAPLVIIFHAAFQSRNLLATVTSVSLGVVVFTGIIGRYIWSLVPTAKGKSVQQSDLQARWERQQQEFKGLLNEATDPDAMKKLVAWVTSEHTGDGRLLAHLVKLPARRLQARAALRRARRAFRLSDGYSEFRESFRSLMRLQTQLEFYRSLKKFMTVWRALHVVLAVLMVFVITAHIGVSVYLGYTWILR